MPISIGEIVSALSLVTLFVFNIITVNRASKGSDKADGELYGQIMTQLGYLQGQLETLTLKIDSQNAAHYALSERVGRVEESAKYAYKRIDRLEGCETREERI